MIHYTILFIYSLLIGWLCLKIWAKTKEPTFIIGIGLLYYWSLAGSWFIIYDGLTGNKGAEFGLHYYHYCEVLFPIYLDNYYLLSISYYALFIIGLQLSILFLAKQKNIGEVDDENLFSPLQINHALLWLLCVAGVIISGAIVWKEILTAAKFSQSVYVVTRHTPNKLFVFHQLINFSMVVGLYIGLISYFSAEKGRYIAFVSKKKSLLMLLAYTLCIFLVEGYLLLLGNKREILFAGIFGFLFYYHNVKGQIKWQHLVIMVIIIFTPMLFSNGIRAYSPQFLLNLFYTEDLQLGFKEKIIYTQFTMKSSALSFLFSNEMFASHFSMYGTLSKHLPLTFGKSLWSLVYSFVPRFILPDRPETAYDYYVYMVNAVAGEGYTINHATAWYINFGVIGILLGALLLGGIWVWLFNMKNQFATMKNRFVQLFFIFGIYAITAQIPTLIRSGPEGYKALIFEGLLIPTLVIYFLSLFKKQE
jgi:hypothetical protein